MGSKKATVVTENYFGAEVEPLEIIESKYGKIYVGRTYNASGDENISLYNKWGADAMDLSQIDTDEFEQALKEKTAKGKANEAV